MLNRLEKDVLKFLLLLAVIIFGCRITNGWFAWLLVAVGCWACVLDKKNIIITCYILIPLLISFSPVLVGNEKSLGIASRLGQFIILLSILLIPSTKLSNTIWKPKEDYIPIKLLFVYILIAAISSLDGWMPLISYFKIINFVLFILGIVILSRIIQTSELELYHIRIILIGLSTFIILGSIFAYFIPSVGYSMEVNKALAWGIEISGKDVASRIGRKYFNGVMNHSQSLANTVPLYQALLLCDMLLVEKKCSRLHLLIIIVSPLLMYMSRSRTALLIYIVSIIMIYLLCYPLLRIPNNINKKIKRIMYVILVFILIIAAYIQIHNKTLSKWIRKEDNLETDYRSMSEALTASRMRLVEYNLNDFKLNPILGKGFQVMNWHEAAYKSKRISLLSAPIEKGVLPLMVLGETGIVGTIVFIAFLYSFYSTCIRLHYRVLLCLFTTLLASNMSEASFFSPGGGSMQWIIAVIGGFCLDLMIKQKIKFYESTYLKN